MSMFYRYTNIYLREREREPLKRWRRGAFYSAVVLLFFLYYSLIISAIDVLKDKEKIYHPGFWEILHEEHTLSLILGITGLVVYVILLFMKDGMLEDLYKILSPECGGSTVCRQEVDTRANAPETLLLPNLQVLLAPGILIGLHGGMKDNRVAVIRYDEIWRIRIVNVTFPVKDEKTGGWGYDPKWSYVADSTTGYHLTIFSVSEYTEEIEKEVELICERCKIYNPAFEIEGDKPNLKKYNRIVKENAGKNLKKRKNLKERKNE